MKPKVVVKKKTIAKTPFRDRCMEYMDEDGQLLKRLKITKSLFISFPHKNKVPFWARMAIKVLRATGGKLDVKFTDISK